MLPDGQTYRERGFTLVEILVAFVITALVAHAVISILSLSSKRLSDSQRHRAALALAENLVARAGYDIDLKTGQMQGDDAEGLHWEITSSPYSDAQDSSGSTLIPYKVQVDVNWPGSFRNASIRLETVKLAVRLP